MSLFSEPTLLVIEDTADDAVFVRVAARRAFPGLDVQVAGDGREGIAYLEGSAPFRDRDIHPFPDLVILDLRMPDIDGFGVLEWLGRQEIPNAPPVVILTVSTDPDQFRRALRLGAKAVYTKPDDVGEMSDLVKEIVRSWMPTDPTWEVPSAAISSTSLAWSIS